MRKRSKYRPKPVIADTLSYVLESITPVTQHTDYLLTLKIKNHAAMAALTKGEATRAEIDTLIQMVNVCEALCRLGHGQEYEDVVREGMDALWAVSVRGAETGRFILKAAEMNALNAITDLHDAQMEVVVVGDIERAIKMVRNEYLGRRMRPIVRAVEPA